MKGIQEKYGPDSIAYLSSGQITVEEIAYLGTLARVGMQMHHGDSNTRQCMATAVSAYTESFGFDAPPYTYADFEASDLIILVGSNLCIAHPILWHRILSSRRNPTIVVIDPRTTETAMAADIHLPLAPKSDLRLFYRLANLLIEKGHLDERFIAHHTEDFGAFKSHVSNYGSEDTAEHTNIADSDLDHLAELIGSAKRTSFWWTMGVNQSHEGVRVAQAIINLALMTGNIGKPGTGANSITGQCNAMGSRLFGNTTNLLGGHDFHSLEDRRKVAGTLGVDETELPEAKSWSYDQIVEGVLRGKIKGLWIVGTNPAHSWVNQGLLKEALGRLDFLVVQDMYDSTETAELAHLVLPAAGWGEKEGTFVNSERRIGRVRAIRPSPGEARTDLEIFQSIRQEWGCLESLEHWEEPEQIFADLKKVTRGQPCDFSGLAGYDQLDRAGGVQWPFARGTSDSRCERRLFEDGWFFRANGRARFCFEPPRKRRELPDDTYPAVLITGRGSVAQWHTQTRTAGSPILSGLSPMRPHVQLNPRDAAAWGIEPDTDVFVESRRGRIRATAHITRLVRPGQVFIPMHYPDTNELTCDEFDPYSRQPSFKAAAVKVSPIEHWRA